MQCVERILIQPGHTPPQLLQLPDRGMAASKHSGYGRPNIDPGFQFTCKQQILCGDHGFIQVQVEDPDTLAHRRDTHRVLVRLESGDQ